MHRKAIWLLLFVTVLLTAPLSTGSAVEAPYANLIDEETLVKSRTFSFKVKPAVKPGKTIYICFRGKFEEEIDGFISVNEGPRFTWNNKSEYYSLDLEVRAGKNIITVGVSSKDEVFVHRAWIVGCEGTLEDITDVREVKRE